MSEPKQTIVYTFKVALKYERDVWRRIEVRGNQTLDHLHSAIYRAFDRYDEHLYSFYLEPRSGYRPRRPSRNAIEYTHPYAAKEGDPWGHRERLDASETTIESLKLGRGRKFEYLFDFGDEWWHEITFEGISKASTKGRYPRVIEKHGDSPPQYPDLDEEW